MTEHKTITIRIPIRRPDIIKYQQSGGRTSALLDYLRVDQEGEPVYHLSELKCWTGGAQRDARSAANSVAERRGDIQLQGKR